MDKETKCSVIMPAYNMAKTIGPAIDTIINQTYKYLELIIVDDGSEDHTGRAVYEKTRGLDPSIKDKIIYLKQRNQKRAGALNTGIKQAKGKYLCFLDADDTLPKDSLEVRVNYLEKNSTKDVVIADTNYIGHNRKIYSVRKPNYKSQDQLVRKLLVALRQPFHLLSAMYRRATFEKAGMFDQSMHRSEDQEFMIRLALNCNIGYLPVPAYNYHLDNHNLSIRIKNRIKAMLEKPEIIGRHSTGVDKVSLCTLNYAIQMMKLGYELFTYKK
jgi:glycosyltransferase involved in cell wall biosynthesis